MRYLCWLWLCFFSLSQYSWADLAATAQRYVGVREVGRNRGYWVEKFLASVGLPPGNPWCAAFVYFCMRHSGTAYPKVRSGLAMAYAVRPVPAKHVWKGYRKVGRNWLVIWKRGDTWRGHIGIVLSWGRKSGTTIEGNTGSSDYEGDGVYEKRREIQPMSFFRIVFFQVTK